MSTAAAAASTRSASPPAARPATSLPVEHAERTVFTTTQSRCGGPLTLIVDDSGSIGSATSVR